MTWHIYLKQTTYISNAMNVSRRTIYDWIAKNKVPPERFTHLKTVLKKLGHNITETEMRKLNESV